jgi:hypothetical protein
MRELCGGHLRCSIDQRMYWLLCRYLSGQHGGIKLRELPHGHVYRKHGRIELLELRDGNLLSRYWLVGGVEL